MSGHQFFQQALQTNAYKSKTIQKYITGFMLTQMTATAGIKKHGQRAIEALMNEFLQLHNKDVFEPMHAHKLTNDQKRRALRAINLIKEKRCGKLKGRTVADGSMQRNRYTKEETTSPTISVDALMLTMLVDAKEKRDVATADVEGAYLHADMDEFVLLQLTGATVDIIIEVHSMYAEYVTINEKGIKVLYLRLRKALYGCVRSALLWYELFVSVLQDFGFELNPYDPCVANATIEGTQCTIAWYVDDNKISHVNPAVVSSIIAHIESKFGAMTVTRGNKHDFLGMGIVFTTKHTVEIHMEKYVDDALIDSGFIFSAAGAATPAKSCLFDVNPSSPLLSAPEADLFHRLVAKLLYLSKHGRPDIMLAIAFLTTRVSCSTVDDLEKLKRVFLYLKGTRSLFLTLGADSLTKITTYVDASYAVHLDMKSHTGGAITLGTGALMCKSTKQKLNTKSSTEAEVVGASDFLPSAIWTRMFLQAQGFVLTENFFLQDNKSAILLELNGRGSSGQKTRHIDIRYFFMQDRFTSEGMTVVYCPTEMMLADFFTKPLQGNLFRSLRDVILGYHHILTLDPGAIAIPSVPTAPIEERVELNIVPESQCDSNGFTVHRKRQRRRPRVIAVS